MWLGIRSAFKTDLPPTVQELTTMEEPIVGRRTVLSSGAAMAASLSLGSTPLQAGDPAVNSSNPEMSDVLLMVNGAEHVVHVDTRMTLLDALRERLHLAGSKKGCDQGQCGACTVHIDGERHLSCLTLAVAAQGHQITTIEGLAQGDRLHPMQQAFIDHDAFQCGYCTSGQIMSAVACVREGHTGTDADIREYMSGNLCRCAAYPNIVAAIKQAGKAMEKS
ncbi:(2Fe-2S)-binding protein [Sphingomonas morindae]|uniref:(2Fe-2S)-binding protein n=1 Tax=Sphingomonas morindae TaxID=1541170 RepID=A0ABY4XAI7_9SPHN|nr:(2Fe-2S)-binding protein [Sphingomonas morindae]USI73890.1 (2Fe-2S)-binding protein [Sphingomonas morindae]